MKLKLLTTILLFTLVFGTSMSVMAADAETFTDADTPVANANEDVFSANESDPEMFVDGYHESVEAFSSEEMEGTDTTIGDFVIDGIVYRSDESGNTCGIVGYTDDLPTSVTINTRANGQRVTWISDGAFNNCKTLNSLTIEAALITVGQEIFAGCDNLTITC